MITLDPALAAHVAAARQAPASAEVAARTLPLLDLTSLNDDDTDERIEALCAKAAGPLGHAAAVCVYPQFIGVARSRLAGRPVRIATVVNFPDGGADPAIVMRETEAAVQAGADEIDVVMPWSLAAAGEWTHIYDLLADCRAACPKRILKVILETGALDAAGLIRQACDYAIAAGADFLKTSTGKRHPAATLEAAAVMLDVIKGAEQPVGFKAAGGIRDTQTAAAYLALADRILGPQWAAPSSFRFGASGLYDALLADLGHGAGPAASAY